MAAVRRSVVTESVAFRSLASLVVVRRHRARLDVVSGSFGTEPVRRSAVWICGHNYPTPQLHFPFLCNKLVLDVISNIYLIEGRFNNSRLVDGNNVGHQDFFFCVVISFRLPTERVRLETFRLPSRSVAHVPELYIERKLTFTYIPVSVFRRRVYGFS